MDGERDDTRGLGDGRRRGDGKRDPRADAKRDAYVAEISARLRHVCQHLTDDEFASLVADLAETRLRFAAIDAGCWPAPAGRADRTATAPHEPEGASE